MEDFLVLERPAITVEKKMRVPFIKPEVSDKKRGNNLVPDKLAAEVDENFLNYLSRNGLSKEDNLLILSSKLHYYYDYEELKEVKTLINLKKLNLIKHLDDFLQSLYNGLSPKANFIGCFYDRKSHKGVSVAARLYNRLINLLDSKIYLDIDSRDFSRLLESHGFKIIDMTEINGLTYFRTQNHRKIA